ncbi:embryo-specific protein ATS3A-like [Durio zibethinus]|uniref:Embryo-specific protein ATS3A-like n=1 Tax=Durio zibethinus TaxID=66656 RepID=A0A6P5ZLZ0_DURZI|nr:embryo-specific protein ATS3A-like [Durio zibethinus]
MEIKNRKGFIIACFIFLLALLAGGENLPQSMKRNCTYRVTIQTTCTKGADTSDHVSLRFGDTKSNDIVVRHLNSKHVREMDPLQPVVLDDIPRKPFQVCLVDEFQVRGQCVESPVCYLYLKLSGNDDWRPGFAQVEALEESHLSSRYFYFRRYLPRNVWHGSDFCDKEVTPFGIRQKKKAYAKKQETLMP